MDHGIQRRVHFGTMLVLNAFRHQRMDHSVANWANASSCVVLNAFRHQRMDHQGGVIQVSSPVAGAQRLSASTNGSRPRQTHSLIVCLCSTPFGINEWITRDRAASLPVRVVLNAFRHQRMDHRPQLAERTQGSCAQRLSASTNGSREEEDWDYCTSRCSTPFGINEWITIGR